MAIDQTSQKQIAPSARTERSIWSIGKGEEGDTKTTKEIQLKGATIDSYSYQTANKLTYLQEEGPERDSPI